MCSQIVAVEQEHPYWAEMRKGELVWEKRRNNQVFKLARAYFAKIKKRAVHMALRKTMRATNLTRSERMKLAYTKQYSGFDMVEEFPIFAEITHIDDLYPYFDAHSDRATLDAIIAVAESLINYPKIFNKPLPPELQPSEPTLEELRASKERLDKLLRPHRQPPRFAVKG